MPRNVALVAGATGLIGGYLVRILLEDAFFDSVVTIGRRTLPLHHPKLVQRIVEFDNLEPRDMDAPTHIFCALGTTIKQAGTREAFRKIDYGAVLALAKAGIAAGASRMILVSSVGASPGSTNFYLRVKGDMERDIAALPFDAVHIFQPSFLLGSRAEPRPGEGAATAIARALEWAMTGPLRKYRPVPAPLVAQAMAAAAERGASGVHIHQFDGIVSLAPA